MSEWDFLWDLEGQELIDAMTSGGTYDDWAYIERMERKQYGFDDDDYYDDDYYDDGDEDADVASAKTPRFKGAKVLYMTFTTQNEMSSIPMRMTSAMMALVPVLVLFLCFHEKLLGNLTVGGIKG